MYYIGIDRHQSQRRSWNIHIFYCGCGFGCHCSLDNASLERNNRFKPMVCIGE
jgi:hypothetical protein